ncbi:MAG TPA: type II secretion system minor pseudopilin GspK [Thermodesulfovibrionales bacterium]|nr:type II secretion system minor pseudopilin GspK [Thermodesulfovibrionales bacterium]
MKSAIRSLRSTLQSPSEDGFALVLTLVVLVLITAMVVEFSYGIYTTTSALHNWETSQKLSFVSRSGVTLAIKTISTDIPQSELYRFPGKMDIPVENILDGFTGTETVSVEDENAKFNLNSLVSQNGQVDTTSSDAFKSLLGNLGFDENAAKEITGRIVDWMDIDSIPSEGLSDSEQNAKNAHMDSVDELLMIKGIDRKTYEKLLPYVTVYGYQGPYNALININTASIPVIMSLGISEMQAQEILNYRKLTPFKTTGELQSAGINPSLINSLQGKIVFSPTNFRITSVAEENKIKRVIECVITTSGLSQTVMSWREM